MTDGSDDWSGVWEQLSDDEIERVMAEAPRALRERRKQRREQQRKQERREREREERQRAREIVDGADPETVEKIAQQGLETGSHLWHQLPIEKFEGIRSPSRPSSDAIEQAAKRKVRERRQAQGFSAGAPVRQRATVVGSIDPVEFIVGAAIAFFLLR